MTKLTFVSAIASLAAASTLTIGCGSQTEPKTAAEAAGCSALGDTRQATSSLLAPGNVYGAEASDPEQFEARASRRAEVYLHATPGASREYVERVLTCHAAQGQALNASDPFHPQSGRVDSVKVRSARAGYAVRITGDSTKTNDEIIARARGLVVPSAVHVEQVASANAAPSTH